MPESVIIVPYNPLWPRLYDEESRRILEATPDAIVAIEHIGSTSVPGLGAKPIVDIMAGVGSLSDATRCVEPLSRLDYVYKPEHEVALPDRRYFSKPGYHLHMVDLGSEFWIRHLVFRNALRDNALIADEYYKLKVAMAEKFRTDREGYTESKTDFIRSVVARFSSEGSSC